MSKYLKSGPSKRLKSTQISAPLPAVTSLPNSDVITRNASGYTDNDERLFDELSRNAQRSTRVSRTHRKQHSDYKTPYTTQDVKLFNSILPDNKQSPIESHDSLSPTTGIKIMEFNDQPTTTSNNTALSSGQPISVRYFD